MAPTDRDAHSRHTHTVGHRPGPSSCAIVTHPQHNNTTARQTERPTDRTKTMPTVQQEEAAAAAATSLALKSPDAASSSAAAAAEQQQEGAAPVQQHGSGATTTAAATPASGAGAPDDHYHQDEDGRAHPQPLSGASIDSVASLPEGVTPRSLSDYAELMAAVAAVRELLRDAGVEGEKELLPTGFIVQCLRSRSGVVAEAALVATNFLRFRQVEAQWPLRLTAEEVAGGPLESGTHWILPGRDAEGRGIFVFNLGRIDTGKGSLEEYQKMGAYLVERFTREEDIQRLGIVMVANLHAVPFSLYRKLMSPRDSRRAIRMWQEAFPCKLKKIYVVGASSLMTHLLQFVVALLGKKLRSRVRVLSHIDDLVTKEGLPSAVLPPELGGTLEGFDWAGWCKEALGREGKGEDADPVWGWV